MGDFRVYVNGEWYASGTYAECEAICNRLLCDPEEVYVCELVADFPEWEDERY